MSYSLYPLPLLLALIGCSNPAEAPPDPVRDEGEIRSVIEGLSRAWEAGDGEAWSEYFAEEADFTVWFGLRLNGREEIGFGHQIIFDDIYAGTIFEMEVSEISFPTRDIAIALLYGRVRRDGDIPDSPEAAPLAVLRRIDRGWEIVAFQNTPYAVEELRQNGDLARFKAWARSLSMSGGGN